jgi:hypothetical protein
MSTVVNAVADRLVGEQVSRMRALVAAAIVGAASAAVTYRLLRQQTSPPQPRADAAGD